MINFLLTQSSDNIPRNLPQEPTIQNAWAACIIIGIMIFLIMLVIIIAIYTTKRKEIKRLQELVKTDITAEEQTLINRYRKLNAQEKNLIDDNLKNLINKNEISNKMDKDDGN